MDPMVTFPYDPSGGASDTFPLLHLELRSDGSFNARLNQSSDTQKWRITTDENGISCVQGNLDLPCETRISDNRRNNCKLRPRKPSASLTDADADTVTLPGDDADDGKPTESPEHPYVYYRVYTYDGAIPSNSPAYLNDLYLGRICVEQMALPRNVKSLRRCISAVEGIGDHSRIILYTSATSETPMDDNSPIALNSFPGSTPDDPMTLLFKGSDTKCIRSATKPTVVLLPPPDRKTPLEPRFLYYQIYTEDGAILSKRPISSQSPSLGRINVDEIALPHTTTSIKRCIARAEQLNGHISSQLFANISSESPMSEARASTLTNDFPGSYAKDPMVYVHIPPAKLKAIYALDWSHYPGWLKLAADEIFDTDGVARQQSAAASGMQSAYTAMNSEGLQGFVYASYAQLM